jgi:hypothetical protein
MKCNEMRERQRGEMKYNEMRERQRGEMKWNARASAELLRPIILIGTPAAKCALGSTSILAGIAKFATVTFLLAF